jgi:hypothetical protein
MIPISISDYSSVHRPSGGASALVKHGKPDNAGL